jgi:hypothetical protein
VRPSETPARPAIDPRRLSEPPPTAPLKLIDSELHAVMRAAAPLPVDMRDDFLRTVATERSPAGKQCWYGIASRSRLSFVKVNSDCVGWLLSLSPVTMQL